MTAEEAEKQAQWLMQQATMLGEVETRVRDWVRGHYCESLRSHPEVVDMLTGPEIAQVRTSLREAAMLLDRAAAVKFYGEH